MCCTFVGVACSFYLLAIHVIGHAHSCELFASHSGLLANFAKSQSIEYRRSSTMICFDFRGVPLSKLLHIITTLCICDTMSFQWVISAFSLKAIVLLIWSASRPSSVVCDLIDRLIVTWNPFHFILVFIDDAITFIGVIQFQWVSAVAWHSSILECIDLHRSSGKRIDHHRSSLGSSPFCLH